MWWARLLNNIAALNSSALPSIPTANLYANYDFSDASKISLSGSNITQILDSSGNGRTISQGTSANQPTQVISALNGKNGASFDGVNDILSASSLTGVDSVSLYLVQRIDASGGSDQIFLGIGAATTSQLRSFYTPSAASTMHVASFGNSYDSSISNDTGVFHAWGGVLNKAALTASVQRDATNSSGAYTALVTPSSTAIGLGGFGSSFYAKTVICEAIIYNTAHNTTEMNAVISYLKAKWGTP